jgi:hypothetical protein
LIEPVMHLGTGLTAWAAGFKRVSCMKNANPGASGGA